MDALLSSGDYGKLYLLLTEKVWCALSMHLIQKPLDKVLRP